MEYEIVYSDKFSKDIEAHKKSGKKINFSKNWHPDWWTAGTSHYRNRQAGAIERWKKGTMVAQDYTKTSFDLRNSIRCCCCALNGCTQSLWWEI